MMHLHIGNVGLSPSGLVLVLAWMAALVYAATAWKKTKGDKDWAVMMLLVAASYPWQFVLSIAFSLIGWDRIVNVRVGMWVEAVLAFLPLIGAFWLASRRYQRGG